MAIEVLDSSAPQSGGRICMNIGALKERLQKKQQDLQADMARHEGEAGADGRPEVNDQAVSSEDGEEQFQQATSDWRLIEQVREALDRIEQGTYGKCSDCGRQIEPARLTAIPWARYCLDDQNRRDRLSGADKSEPTL
ncbi:MAG: TraR/DksA family transcriptional regulator [Acidobacteriota bacterium]